MTLSKSLYTDSSFKRTQKCLFCGLSLFFIATASDAGAIRHHVDGEGEDEVLDWKPNGRGHGTPSANAPLRATGRATMKRRVQATATGYGISYHGGPVMGGAINIYYIWYGNWTGNSATTILTDFARSFTGSSYMNINRTYSTSDTVVTNQSSFVKSTTDNYSQGTVLTDQKVYYILKSALDSGRLPSDPNGVYFVLTSKDVSETSGLCSSYCGWHTSMSISTTNIRYAFVGNPDRCPSTCGAQTISPNGNAGADGMASIIAHEFSETVTDPDLSAWYDASGLENADKCAWKFGTTNTTAGYKWNVTLGGRKYYLQQNWVNAQKLSGTTATEGYCGLSY